MCLFNSFFSELKLIFVVRCEHESRKSAEACITEMIDKSNAEHFFVATQDTNLRKKLQEVIPETF